MSSFVVKRMSGQNAGCSDRVAADMMALTEFESRRRLKIP
jgi:hypothetical protein